MSETRVMRRNPWRRLDLAPTVRVWDEDFNYLRTVEQPRQLEPWPRWARRVTRMFLLRTLTHWSVFTVAAGLIVGAALYYSIPANASPADEYAAIEWPTICGALDSAPYLSTLDAVGAAVMTDTGWSAYDAGVVIGTAVYGYCPQHAALLDRYIAVYRPHRTVA